MAAKSRKKKAVRGPKSSRSIIVLLDLLGRRWTLRIIWELNDREMTSRALREACDDVSPTVLHARLSDLRSAGLVELIPASGYRLTGKGRSLSASFKPLIKFASQLGKSAKRK
jgi:DNA-binding HxlR family transcriptional regulator